MSCDCDCGGCVFSSSIGNCFPQIIFTLPSETPAPARPVLLVACGAARSRPCQDAEVAAFDESGSLVFYPILTCVHHHQVMLGA